MAATVTIDKAYFETLLRRYVQYQSSCDSIGLTNVRAEFVRPTYETARDTHSRLMVCVAYLWQRLDDACGHTGCQHTKS